MRQLTWFPFLFILVAVALGGCEKEEAPKWQANAPAAEEFTARAGGPSSRVWPDLSHKFIPLDGFIVDYRPQISQQGEKINWLKFNAKTSDIEIKHLTGMADLMTHEFYLTFSNSNITDVGLINLAKMENLIWIGLDKTQVTDAGVAEFQKALPNCEIEYTADDVGQSTGRPEVSERLLEAVAKGDIKVVKQLLAKGADVGAKNAGGETILNQAVFNSHKEMVELLIEKGANVNEKYDSGETPLHLAVHLDDLEIAEVLIKKGANVNAKTSSRFLAETPLDRATITSEIVRLLRKHGGKTALELEAEQE